MRKRKIGGSLKIVTGIVSHLILCCPVPIMGSFFVGSQGFFIAEGTKIKKNGKKATLHDIDDGSNVRIAYILGVDTITIKRVEIL